MKSVSGKSPHAWKSQEWFSVTVSVKAITGNPYGSRRPDDCVELRIGEGKRLRIARLKSEAACQLAYGMIEAARKVEMNEASVGGFDKGIVQGYRDAIQEARTKKKEKQGRGAP